MRPVARDDEGRAPPDFRLVPGALSVWAGCLLGLSGAAWAPVLAAASGGVGLGVILWSLRRRRRWLAGAVVALALGGAGLATAWAAMHAARADPVRQAARDGAAASVVLTTTSDAEPVRTAFVRSDADGSGTEPPAGPPQRWRIGARGQSVQWAGQGWGTASQVTVYAADPSWAALPPGTVLRVSGTLRENLFAAVPGVLLQADGPPQVLQAAPVWQRAAWLIRDRLRSTSQVLSPDRAGLLLGFVVGDTRDIDDRLDADAKATGLTHLVAVSGSHFALLVGITVVVLRRIGPRVAAVGGATVLGGLILLVGPQPSVLRSAVMAVVALLALVSGRSRTALPALAGAVIALLLLDPALAVSAGFALSVQATAALVLIAPAWSAGLQRRGVPPGWADLLAIAAAANVATVPVIAAISGSVSLVSIPANMLAAPVVAPALVIGMVAALIGPWWPAGAASAARADGPLLGWVAGVAHRLARWPGATVGWPATTGWMLVLAGSLTVGLLLLRRRRVRAAVLAALVGAAAILIPAHLLPPGWPMDGWLLTGCEVGQGDALVLATGEQGTAVVVDAGPDPALVASCLDSLGVGTVPLLVLTHLHADHVDGLAGVLDGRSVGAIGVGPDREPAAAWRSVTAAAAARGIPVVELEPGTRWRSGQLDLTVLGPRAAFHGTASDPNNDSVVIMASAVGVRVLLTGDIEPEAQRELLSAGVDLTADVLKQPHHGSARVLPEFLAAVAPQVVVIEVGRGNDYGHPSRAVLERLAAMGVPVLRTDTDGAVQVGVSGGELTATARGPTAVAGAGARR